MASPIQQRRVEGRRAAIACQRCRQSKLRCSGTYPCERCQKRSDECFFDTPDPQYGLASSEAPTDEAVRKRRSYQHCEEPASKRRAINDDVTIETLTPKSTRGHSLYLKNRQSNRSRRWLYLGVSSTWSFNVRTASIIQSYLGVDSLDLSYQFSLDGDAYSVDWTRLDNTRQPDLDRLPSFDYALYLINTVKYHLGGVFHIFHEDLFMQEMHNFYAEEPGKRPIYRLWFTQYLMLLAFGKSLLHSTRTTGLPSGTEFFTRAMAILPEISKLHEDPVLAIEVLCLISLYFHCLDMRQTAYSYIGQALRIALAEGMHTNIPQAQIGEEFSARCNSVWWTTYILDRMLSATVGAPVSVRDEDISSVLSKPAKSSVRLATLALHVKLSRLISFILTELYSASGSLERSYLTQTRVVLRSMAAIAEEMEQVIDIKFKTSLDTITRAATHLRLLYHQCIILATRPLLLCLLQEMAKPYESSFTRPKISPALHDLIQSCTKSALKTLRIMDALRSHNMLDLFLPFDLEYLCAARSVLIVVDNVLRCISVPQTAVALGNQALSEIVESGNAVARLRQKELEGLQNLAELLWQRQLSGNGNIEQRVRRPPSLMEAVDTPAQSVPQQSAFDERNSTHADDTPIVDATPAISRSTQQLEIMSPVTRISAAVSPSGSIHMLNERSQHDTITGYNSIFENDIFATFSTTSSQDLANNMDLARDEILLLADQLDLDGMSDGLFFNTG